jgi:hypothetical protein
VDTSTRWLVEHPLVSPDKFADAAADGLFERLHGDPSQDALIKAMDLLAVSREESVSFGTHRFTSAFTAFETSVDAYAVEHGLRGTGSNEQRSRFIEAVRKAIREFARHEPADEVGFNATLQKVPDLLRPGFVALAVKVLTGLGVDTGDILPPGVSIKKELSGIGKRRGGLVHVGNEPPIGQAFADEARLNLLTERVIYSWLGGKPEWLHPIIPHDNKWLTRPGGEDV